MTADILAFSKTQHQRALEALPWFVMGTLEADEEQMVERHLQGCAECRAQLAAERRLRELYVGGDFAPDPEAALSRLRPQLGATAAPRLARLTARLRRALPRPPAWARLALATQLGVILALGWALHRGEASVEAYRTLAAPAPAGRGLGQAVVVLDPGARQQDVQRILRSSGARIVDGPLASGAYVLELPAGSLGAALERLRGEPAVRLIEPLQAQDTRP